MLMAILFECDIINRVRDPDGVSYDVAISWVGGTLPAGAVDPDGAEILCQSSNAKTHEEIRDDIRSAVIIELERPVISGGYGFSGLIFDNIRVEGHSNAGNDATFSPTAPIPWMSGDPFVPLFGGRIGTKAIPRCRVEALLDPNMPETQQPDAITFTLSFSFGMLPSLTSMAGKLEYWVWAYDATAEGAGMQWEAMIPSVLVNGNQLVLTKDLSLVAQDPLWATETLLFTLQLKRLVNSTIGNNWPGKITGASIVLTRN